jgi:hypothetical protein
VYCYVKVSSRVMARTSKARSGDPWERWKRLITDPSTQPLDVIRASGEYQSYFSRVEREAIKAARAKCISWERIGDALGTTRQAAWQRYGQVVADAKDDPRSFVTWLRRETKEFVPAPPAIASHSPRRAKYRAS